MEKYNKEQIEAIECEDDVVLVIAGAGSGKTTVLTKRIERLIDKDGVDPNSILAITFTNKATNEMKERLIKNLGPYGTDITVNTFHSFAARIIRFNTEFLPKHTANYLIIDEDDKKRIIKQILHELNLHEMYKVPQVRHAISSAKSFAKNLRDVSSNLEFGYLEVYEKYHQYCMENNAMDFDDLLLYAYELLKVEEVRNKFHRKYKFIHVDEFQDTSVIQGEILNLIKSEEAKLFIVGDVDQSIYEWRGATIENIMNIEKRYDNVRVIKLEQNYRSTNNILQAANKLIEHNSNRYDKTLFSNKPNGEKIKCYRFNDMTSESLHVIREIKYLKDFGKPLGEIAVLYRYNYQSKKIEESLVKNNIPYQIFGGLRFYERMEIKDILAYLRIIVNNDDNISFSRIINTPRRKIGEVSIKKIHRYAELNDISLFESAIIIGNTEIKRVLTYLKSVVLDSSDDFIETFDELINAIKYHEYLNKLDESSVVDERKKNIDEFKYAIRDALRDGSNITDYLNELLLFSEKSNDEQNDGVILSTVHGVKGLEYDYVFMIGLNEEIFPKKLESIQINEMEEERRVCYVAVTRARKKVMISNISYDYRGFYFDDSRFISEMGIDNVEEGFGSFSIF